MDPIAACDYGLHICKRKVRAPQGMMPGNSRAEKR